MQKNMWIGWAMALALGSWGCHEHMRPAGQQSGADELFKKSPHQETRWISFENPTGEKGKGAQENMGAKGHAFDSFVQGSTRVLCDIKGSGTIRRIWMTLNNRKPKVLRGIRINMYWDNADKPAVSAPLGDFFGWILGQSRAFENEFLSSPEGRSFVSVMPMPFRTGARITVTNESDEDVGLLFYDVDCTVGDKHGDDVLYFHAFWRREALTKLGVDFEILPQVLGDGRFLGCHIGVIANPINKGWWGEGEVKMYVDGDTTWPTIAGTGTEDYIGTGWGQGEYIQRFQGCMQADKDKRYYSFYRYHVPDPVYFHEDCRVTIQQIGGSQQKDIVDMLQAGVPIVPISCDAGGTFTRLFADQASLVLDEQGKITDIRLDRPIKTESIPEGWVNYYRQDDVSAVAYFYLDRPFSNLPELTSPGLRMEAIK